MRNKRICEMREKEFMNLIKTRDITEDDLCGDISCQSCNYWRCCLNE